MNLMTVWYGNFGGFKPEDRDEFPKMMDKESQVLFYLAEGLFAIGYNWRQRELIDSEEDALEAFRSSKRYSNRVPVPKWFIEDMEVGDYIIAAPDGKNGQMRMVGEVTSGWYLRKDDMAISVKAFQCRDVDWVYVHREELPEEIQDYHAGPALQRVKKLDDEDAIETLHKRKKQEQSGTEVK